MTVNQDPIGAFGRMNAGILMAVTPEYKKVKAMQQPNAGCITARPVEFAIKPVYKTIDGLRIRYAEGGRPDGPTVLMLSPLPQSVLAFEPIWSTLAAHFRLVALDLPGFGRSEGGTEYMTFEAQSRFLESFVREMDLKQFHIIGPDVGMPVAVHYAIHRKHELASLIIGDGPTILPSANGTIINKFVVSPFWRAIMQIAGAPAFVDGGYRLGCLNYVPNTAEAADYVASYKGRLGPIALWFKDYEKSMETVDPYLDALDVPTQIFWGEQDQFLFVDNARRLHEKLKRSRLRIFENCGHFSYQDQHEQFGAMIVDWVGGGFREVGR